MGNGKEHKEIRKNKAETKGGKEKGRKDKKLGMVALDL